MSKTSAARVDLLSLRLLVAAADEGNLAAVAAREHIALSGVSRRIADLEQRWGVQLLHRHDRGVRPTAALEAIIGRLRGVFQLLDQVTDDISAIESGVRGLVRVSANNTAMSGSLGSHVAQFIKMHSLIEVQLEEATSVDILHALRVGTCDLGVISGTVNADGVNLHPWLTDELVAVLPPGHELAEAETVTFEQLLDHPFITMQRNSALQLLYRSHAETVDRTIHERAYVGSFAAVQQLVGLGIGVAILPRVGIAADTGAHVVFRPLNEKWSRRTLMISTPQGPISSATKLFLQFLVEQDPLASCQPNQGG